MLCKGSALESFLLFSQDFLFNFLAIFYISLLGLNNRILFSDILEAEVHDQGVSRSGLVTLGGRASAHEVGQLIL